MDDRQASDSPAESNDSQELPQQPAKKPAKRKIKRAYSRTLKRGAKDQKNPHDSLAPPPPPPLPAASVSSQSQVVRRSATTQGAARNTSRAELQSELNSVLDQNALLQSQLDAVTKKLAVSESKRIVAVESLQAGQAKARESLKALRDAESVAARQAKEISIAHEHNELIVQDQAQRLKRKHQVSLALIIVSLSRINLTAIAQYLFRIYTSAVWMQRGRSQRGRWKWRGRSISHN